jgi:thiol-disulfide isomerase/thioredoxin
MKRSGAWGISVASIVAALTAGCTSGEEEPPRPLPGSAKTSKAAYPSGPYGVTVGQVIANFDFDCYVNANRGTGASFQRELELADLYNPDGEGLHEAGSPFTPDTAKPRALVVNVGAFWCVPCRHEAEKIFPAEYARFAPLGGELMFVLAETQNPGEVADFSWLDKWVKDLDAAYVSCVDLDYQIGALFDAKTFPANVIIDTADMRIVTVVTGIPEDSFWQTLEQLLAGE